MEILLGVQFQNMDANGIISYANKKALTNEEKELYKMHHKTKSILVKSISYSDSQKEEEVAKRTTTTKEASDKMIDDKDDEEANAALLDSAIPDENSNS
ncbi:hypothetical protein A2U01_0016904, partial [Trifolium medium]|nr:hypothetical protein [Trifolium medium]